MSARFTQRQPADLLHPLSFHVCRTLYVTIVQRVQLHEGFLHVAHEAKALRVNIVDRAHDVFVVLELSMLENAP